MMVMQNRHKKNLKKTVQGGEVPEEILEVAASNNTALVNIVTAQVAAKAKPKD